MIFGAEGKKIKINTRIGNIENGIPNFPHGYKLEFFMVFKKPKDLILIFLGKDWASSVYEPAVFFYEFWGFNQNIPLSFNKGV